MNQPVTVGNLVAFVLGVGIGAFVIVVARLIADAFDNRRWPR